eukprot:SAG11_NODE_5558_length_1525_cov_3.573633_1_plen_51_part_10
MMATIGQPAGKWRPLLPPALALVLLWAPLCLAQSAPSCAALQPPQLAATVA